MALWTPQDLRSIDYIRQNFTERDKSLALDQCLRELPDAIKREEALTARELELRDQLNDGPYSFSNVRTLRQRNTEVENDPNASVQDKADAYNNWQMAQAQRDSLNTTYSQVVANLASATEYVISLKQGIANLRQLGATEPTSSTQPVGNQSLSQPQEVVQGEQAPIVQTVNTPNIDTTVTGAIEPIEEIVGQGQTSITLGANQFNEFATDIQTQQEITDDTGNDAGGEDSVVGQLNTDEQGLGSSFVEPDVFGADTELQNDEDPNLTALERGDLDEIQSDDDNVNQDEDPNLTALEAGDQDEIVIGQQSSNQRNIGNQDTDQANEQIENGTTAPSARSNVQGVQGGTNSAQNQAGLQYGVNFSTFQDWRVRLKLAPGANYLYKAPASQRGILAPLNATDGVIFPYTPQITVNYVANYDPTNPTHSNYKIMQYQNSAVDAVQIACDFTAQDTNEANYLLASIHFFRSVTKMFYGQDQDPKRGTPPPLCYLVGLGEFQFDMHPLVITAFTYTLPDDVDYIRAMPATGQTGADVNNSGQGGTSNNRLLGTGATAGGTAPNATFQTPQGGQMGEPTYVPTRIKIQLSCMPVVSRKDISEEFSLKQYATGSLLRGSKRNGGGIW
jgi:hypothetical protein